MQDWPRLDVAVNVVGDPTARYGRRNDDETVADGGTGNPVVGRLRCGVQQIGAAATADGTANRATAAAARMWPERRICDTLRTCARTGGLRKGCALRGRRSQRVRLTTKA